MKLGKPRIIDDSAFPERKVVKVKPAPRSSVPYKMGVRCYLTLECGHKYPCNRDFAPQIAKCKACHDNEPISRDTTECPCCGEPLHFAQYQGLRLVTEENGKRVFTARCPSTHKYFKVKA